MTSSSIRPADMFLTRALEKMLADKEMKKSANSQLKKQCEVALNELKKEAKSSSGFVDLEDSERYFIPFEAACKCKSPKITETALDTIQKLIAHGYLNNSASLSSSSALSKQQLVQRLTKTICACFEGPHIDDNIQLQIIKCLLTILTSPHIEIHEQTMLIPIKTCYNIQISSRSLVNQASALAALTQIINTVLSRLEASFNARRTKLKNEEIQRRQQESELNQSGLRANTSASSLGQQQQQQGSANANEETVSLNESTVSTGAAEMDQMNHLNDMIGSMMLSNDHYKQIYMDILRNFECEQLNFHLDQTVDEMNQMEANANVISDLMCTLVDSVCDEPEIVLAEEKLNSEPYGPSMVEATNEINNNAKTAGGKAASANHVGQQNGGAKNDEDRSSGKTVVSGTAVDDQAAANRSAASSKDPELAGIDDPFEIDAFLMFRAFSKLSLRSLSQDASAGGSSFDLKNDIDVKSKILSLKLILATLQNAKQSFKQSPHMISVIRRYLCVSLSKNGVSPITEVFELSLAIFVALLADYKKHLKKQIEVFFREIIIFLLETPTSSFDHKWLVIQALTHVCANAQCVVDLYINYDCDLQSTNLFARLVNVMSKKAQGRQAVDLSCSPVQLRSLRLKGLECVVSVLKCMVEWSKDLYINPNTNQSNLGPENRPPEAENLDSASSNKLKSYDSQNSLNSSSTNSATGHNHHHHQQQRHSGPNGFVDNTSLISTATSGIGSSYNPTDFEMLKSKKELWERGFEIFSKKPKKGVQFFHDNELVGTSADDLAVFFLDEERLDKNAIGEFLGENEKFNKEVMYSYVDHLDFYGMEIVPALRMFVEGFRLPGEAQKIDRLMEKFAARYHELNKKFASAANPAEASDAAAAATTASTSGGLTKSSRKRMLKNYYFETADAVYVLAFSIIMLATDLHSPQVKKKMTKDEYVNMNRGINDSKDLPRDYLESIFDQVAESELKLKGGTALTSTPSAKRGAAESEKQRRLLYNMEIEQVTQTARSLMESVYHVSTSFTSAKYGEHIMPMFKLSWTPFLAAFSIGLQDSDDSKITDLCLNGVRCAIRIACIFRLELERDAYMQALARFTMLTATSPITEMKSKNVECIKALITIAHTDGNYLGKSWYEILKCISHLELAQSIGVNVVNSSPKPAFGGVAQGLGVGGHGGGSSSSSSHAGHSSSSGGGSGSSATTKESSLLNSGIMGSAANNFSSSTMSLNSTAQSSASTRDSISMASSTLDAKSLANIQMQIGETISQSVVVAVDRIFTGSVRLGGDAIVEFVRWLCYVSVDELSASPPRMFSLQKIVEISYYNMGRIRLQWTRIWQVIGEHFNKAGCNPNEEVAFFAVDSLRQLAMKFLEKGEFANFRFQKDFLRPFEHIMKKNNSYGIRDMVVQCIAQMVKSQAQNIKSGWKNIFGVFHLAAAQNDERILVLSFETVNEIIRHCAEKYFLSILDSFQDAIKCLSEFACNSSSPDISIEAIGLIRQCAVFVAEKPDIFIEHGGGNDDLKNIPEDDRVWMSGWFPILFELSCIINRCKLDVRTRGLTVMFEIMKTYGETFKPQWWKELFNIVFRIFDNMKLPEAQIEKAEWMTTTCNHALYAIVDVFTQYFDTMSLILIEDLYTHLKWCVKQDNEQLARSGTNCFENFVISNGVKFSEDIWRKTCSALSEIFKHTVPHALLTWRPDQDMNASFESSTHSPEDSFYEGQQMQPVRMAPSGRNGRTSSVNSEASLYNEDGKSKIPRSRVPTDMEHKIFQSLLIKCVVQLELVQTIDNIVFYPTTSKKEDANYIAAAQALASPTSTSMPASPFMNEQLFHDEFGMYVHLSNEQLFLLLDCLVETYEFAKKFNCNSEQRNILWKAGFKGKDKPNLLKHETQSLACMIRILFKMLNDETRRDFLPNIQTRLLGVCQGALQYYMILPSESHRESWDSLILILLTKIFKLEPNKFKLFSSALYHQFCDILTFNLKAELRNILREIFVQIGKVNAITIPA